MTFELWARSELPAEAAWRAVTDWPRHGRHVPFTTVRRTADGFCARTRLGPLTVDDTMRIETFRPPQGAAPGLCTLVKTGRVVRGQARIEITPLTSGCTVSWSEGLAVGPAWAARLSGPVLDFFGARVFGGVLVRLLAEGSG